MQFKSLVFLSLISIFTGSSVPCCVDSEMIKSTDPKIECKIDLHKIKKSNNIVTLKTVLVICDNYDSPENNAIAQSVRVDMGTVSQMMTILEKRNIVKVEKVLLQGKKATLANIVSTLKNIQCGKDDIIMFYFSGHGGMQNGKTFLVTADEKDLTRTEIEKSISVLPARLKVIITDACSNDVDGLPVARSLNRSNQQVDVGMFDAIYKDLFLGYEGLMHISASSEGEYAWSNDQYGGFFTYHFFKEGLIKKPVNDWKTIFANAKDKTSQMFRAMSDEERSRLAKEGIKNQTAKAFAMPFLTQTPSTGLPSKPTNTIPPVAVSGKITIYNYSNETVNFYQDNNDAKGDWVETKLKQMSLGPGKTVTINQALALVGFRYKRKDYYYELEKGDFFFAMDEKNKLDLFYKDENINAGNYSSVAQPDFSEILQGKWEWDNANSGEVVVSTFLKDSFEEYYQDSDITESGLWTLRKETENDEEYEIISFTYEDEDGSLYEMDYYIIYDEEYPDMLQLVFLTAYENNVEISSKEAEKYIEPTIMMYRTPE